MTAAVAYYNEIDPYAAQWLRNLIDAGHIAPGVVDERSIVDVDPAELTRFTQCHFFAGIGGWAYALRLAGWPDNRPVWTGSCPCQPFSVAGARKGTDDERHLWPAFRWLIAKCRPATVFGEQVASDDGREWLTGVRADLEALDYIVGAADLCAAGAGAPHIRQRLWWVAHANGGVAGHGRIQRSGQLGQQPEDSGLVRVAHAQNANGRPGISGTQEGVRAREGGRRGPAGGGAVSDCGLADASEQRRQQDAGSPPGDEAADGQAGRQQREPDGDNEPVGDGADRTGGLADSIEPGLEGHAGHGDHGDQPGRHATDPAGPTAAGGATGDRLGDTESERRQRRTDLEHAGRGQCPPGQAGPAGFWSAYELIPCLDGKARRVEPGTFPLAHGVPARVGKLRAYGNAIVPQVAKVWIEACGIGPDVVEALVRANYTEQADA